ncbi:MAG: RlmE family RNA methyltransferase [Thermoplasmata archaeon]|nr:MAG: RlmE family RNA methyltransferase [Thermoplasmata archaeon]
MTRWYSEKKREHYYKEAKRLGYRARSAFKLLQIQKKFHVIKKNDIVIDLGAAPGSWSQVAREITGEHGIVIGVDISPVKPINGVIFLQGDMTKDETIEKIRNHLGDRKADVVISDMSPDISGSYSVDHARSIYLCEQALKTVDLLLRNNGNFVCKVFSGEYLDSFIQKVNDRFRVVKQFVPRASRKSSSEVYVIGKYFKKN